MCRVGGEHRGRVEHPLAQAVVQAAHTRGLELAPVIGFEALSGFGVRAQVEGKTVLLAIRASWRTAVWTSVRSPATRIAAALLGQTPIYLAVDGQAAGIVAIADPIKPDSHAAIARLHASASGVMASPATTSPLRRPWPDRWVLMRYLPEVLPADKAAK